MGNEDDSPSAQWAQDPSGRHAFRYWDGSRWTGHVSDEAVAPVDPPKEIHDQATADAGEPNAQTALPAGDPPEAVDAPPEGLRRQRRQVTRRRRAFLLGALAGGGVVIAAGAIAGVLLDVQISTSHTSKRATTTSTSVAPPSSQATTTSSQATTTTVNPGRPPQQVRVEVINASAVPNAATMKASALSTLGYPNAGLADAPVRQGTAVQCKSGFEAEAATLAKNVGPGTSVEPFPNPAPTGSANADCVVVVGK